MFRRAESSTPGGRGRRRAIAGVAVLLVSALAAATVPSLMRSAGATNDDDDDDEQPAAVGGLPVGDEPVDLNPKDFSYNITNPYFPLVPGTRWTFSELDEEGEELRIEMIVTARVRRLPGGFKAREVRDTKYLGDEILEDTRDWYAQDSAGNVWYFGEDTATFEDGKVVSTEGSFKAFADGALPGIMMPAAPVVGMKYRLEYHEGDAEDRSEVFSTTEWAETPLGMYHDVVLTRDTSPLEPDVLQYKFYAPGVGPILTLDVAGGAGREELVKIDQVGPKAGLGPLGHP